MNKSPKRRAKSACKGNSKRRDSWEDRESRDMKRDRKDDSRSTNNPEWYATDPALLRDSSSIPFSWPVGQSWSRNIPDAPDNTQFTDIVQSEPGICVLKLAPTYGAGLDSDAINVAASSMYTYVRHTNAGHANYDPNDLMIYIMSMTNVYSYINYLERAYAIATLYEQENRYLPDGLFYAMGIDPDSIKDNMADFRYGINVLINKVSSLAVPATMTIFLRHAMLYSYVYIEGQSLKDQLYMFAPSAFLLFDLDNDQAGCLKYGMPTPASMNGLTWKELLAFGNLMFNKIWEQEDFGIMSGDILKSYGDNILKIKSLDEYLPFAPVYDPLVLTQIKNSTPFMPFDPNSSGVFQTANKAKLDVILSADGLSASNALKYWIQCKGNRVLTIDSANPTPEMVMESTRLLSGIKSFDPSTTPLSTVRLFAGSEIVVDTMFVYREGIIGRKSNDINKIALSSFNPIIDAGWSNALVTWLAIIRHFKYAPRIVMKNDNLMFDIFEVDNYAVLDQNDVEKLHTAAILNLLNVPSAAKVQMK